MKKKKHTRFASWGSWVFFFNTCHSTSLGYSAILFRRALNKQVLLIFNSSTFGGAGKSQC